jgi:hypothetical protein
VSAPKHTPGPWKLWVAQDARPHAVFLRHALGSIEIPHNGYIDTSDAIAKEQICNARLIAAAPELFQELENALMIFKFGEDDKTVVAPKWVARAEAALAKATGDQS